MKFTTTKKVLDPALRAAGKAVSKRKIVPILGNYLFHITGTTCVITGGNLEVFISSTIQVESDIDYLKIAIPESDLLDTLKFIDDKNEPITFNIKKIEGKNGFISYEILFQIGKGKYSIVAENGEDFMRIPEIDSHVVEIDGQDLLVALDKVHFTIDPNCGKEFLRPCLFDFGNGLSIVGTDSVIFSIQNAYKGTINLNKSLVTKSSLDAMMGLDLNGTIGIKYDKDNLSISTTDTYFVCKLAEGTYPDYRTIIPTTFNYVATLNTKEITMALKRVAQFAERINNEVLFLFTKNNVNLSAQNFEFNKKADEDVEIHYNESEDFEVKFNAHLMISLLSRINSEFVSFNFRDFKYALVIKESGDAEGLNIMLLSPIVTPDYVQK